MEGKENPISACFKRYMKTNQKFRNRVSFDEYNKLELNSLQERTRLNKMIGKIVVLVLKDYDEAVFYCRLLAVHFDSIEVRTANYTRIPFHSSKIECIYEKRENRDSSF